MYASARRDGANLFGVNTNNKWKPYGQRVPDGISQKNTFTKLTGYLLFESGLSYGYAGNNTGAIALTTIRYTSLSTFSNYPTAIIRSVPNPDLRWEQVGILNLGIDFSALSNRIYGSVEWFLKKSKD